MPWRCGEPMPEYRYVAQTSSGKIQRGRIGGSNRSDVREKLNSIGCQLVGIEDANNNTFTSTILVWMRQQRFRPRWSSHLELMLRQLAVMLESGLELSPSLRELSQHCPRRRQQQICSELADAVEQGNAFATAVADTRSFPLVVAQLARIGEESGELPIMLQRAADFMENRREALSNLLSALAYPLLVAIAACAVAVYLVGWAIPKLAVFLHAMGRKLPAMTQSLIDVSHLVQTYGVQVFVLLLAASMASLLIYVWQPGRYRIDENLLRIPLIGSLIGMAETQQLASSLALMLRSGVFLPEALETASKLHRNQFLARKVAGSRDRLANGGDLANSLGGHGFGPLLPSMVAVGERSGELAKALDHVAKFYAALVESRLKRLSRTVEPAIIVVVGGMVGYVYVAFFMALMSAGGNFQ